MIPRKTAVLLFASLFFIGSGAPDARAGDLEIAQEIADALRGGGMRHYNIGIGYRARRAELRGTVRSFEQLHLAVRIAQKHPRVDEVEFREVRIEGTGGSCATLHESLVDAGLMIAACLPVTAAERLGQPCAALPLRLSAALRVPWVAPDRFDVKLSDGSVLADASIRLRRVVLKTEVGEITIPRRLIRSLRHDAGAGTATVNFRNGDILSGKVVAIDPAIRVTTAHARITVGPLAIREVTLRSPK